MITLTEALHEILNEVIPLETEREQLERALFSVLAEDIYSDSDMPPFDKAAVDGFACRRADIGDTLQVIETIAAGQLPQKSIGKGECSRIMTGAILPQGADLVLMLEHTIDCGPEKIRFSGGHTHTNFALKGEEVKKGDLILSRGTLVLPQHIAILASQGITHPLVSKKPRVGIMSTGDELVEPGIAPRLGQIRNSNAYQLMAQTHQAHATPVYHGIVSDNLEATVVAIQEAIATSQIILISGGVSAGDFDLVPQALHSSNIEIVFHKVAIKPGKPTVFARAGKCSIFGLPGNPVSSFINFEIFVKPLISKLMGNLPHQQEFLIPMGVDFSRKKYDRLEFLPVSIDAQGAVQPVIYHGSAHIHAFCQATGIMSIPQGKQTVSKGELVNVRPISS